MGGSKFLIDLTDERFFIAANEDVMAFVRRTNPSAHTDVGALLLELSKETPGARAYCPSFRSLAYVVLHTEADVIFAIAYRMRGLAFRLAADAQADALADGGTPVPDIGAGWVSFPPWDGSTPPVARERVRRWCARALSDATQRTRTPFV